MPNYIRIIVAVALTAIVVLSLGAVGGRTLRPAWAAPAAGPGRIARYFGRGAFDGIRTAVADTPRACALSNNDLTALVMAPIFKEVSMAERPDAVPSPMTLSRWDEWSGIRSGSSNLDANYGLYAFGDPNTPYVRAYWNPGVGIFQYDPAGVGAPFTAAEMISVQYITRDVAAGMAGATAPPGATPAGAAPPLGSPGRRSAASPRARRCSRRCSAGASHRSPASGWSTGSTTSGEWSSGGASAAPSR